jgi:hypothetical protein
MVAKIMHRAAGLRALDLDQGGTAARPWHRLDEDQQQLCGDTYHCDQRRAHLAIKDIFLPLVGEPEVTAIAAIDKCVAVAGDLGARVTAMAVEEDIPIRPTMIVSNDLDNTAAVEAVRSGSDARGLLKAFDAATIRFGVRSKQTLSQLALVDIPRHLAVCARLQDLSLVPVKPVMTGRNGLSSG